MNPTTETIATLDTNLAPGDAIYSDGFRRHVASMEITEVVCAPSSPWQSPYAE